MKMNKTEQNVRHRRVRHCASTAERRSCAPEGVAVPASAPAGRAAQWSPGQKMQSQWPSNDHPMPIRRHKTTIEWPRKPVEHDTGQHFARFKSGWKQKVLGTQRKPLGRPSWHSVAPGRWVWVCTCCTWGTSAVLPFLSAWELILSVITWVVSLYPYSSSCRSCSKEVGTCLGQYWHRTSVIIHLWHTHTHSYTIIIHYECLFLFSFSLSILHPFLQHQYSHGAGLAQQSHVELVVLVSDRAEEFQDLRSKIPRKNPRIWHDLNDLCHVN